MFRMLPRICATAMLALASASAQSVTGTITGTVKDSSSLPVAGATVTLAQPATGSERQASSDARGSFVFRSVVPGEYRITTSPAGLKRYQRTNINLTRADTLSVGDLTRAIGTA